MYVYMYIWCFMFCVAGRLCLTPSRAMRSCWQRTFSTRRMRWETVSQFCTRDGCRYLFIYLFKFIHIYICSRRAVHMSIYSIHYIDYISRYIDTYTLYVYIRPIRPRAAALHLRHLRYKQQVRSKSNIDISISNFDIRRWILCRHGDG